MKQETLEEAAYQARRDYQDEVGKDGMNECIMFDAMKIQKGFKLGAKWQQEKGNKELLFFGEWIFDQFNLNTDIPVSRLIEEYLITKKL